MLFGEQFQALIDAVVTLITNAIMLQFSEIFALIELFQTLTGGGAGA